MQRLMIPILMFLAVLVPSISVAEQAHRHEAGSPCGVSDDAPSLPDGRFEGVQIETADIVPHETFFETVLKAQPVFKVDHPQVDHLRGYCYRDVLIVVRQDLKTPRPTGWVQVNFAVRDVAALKAQLERTIDENDRTKVARLRFKPDVPRSNCRVSRLEIYGPEGFMVGFDQTKPETCKTGEEGEAK